jgi:hypothetical protein
MQEFTLCVYSRGHLYPAFSHQLHPAFQGICFQVFFFTRFEQYLFHLAAPLRIMDGFRSCPVMWNTQIHIKSILFRNAPPTVSTKNMVLFHFLPALIAVEDAAKETGAIILLQD